MWISPPSLLLLLLCFLFTSFSCRLSFCSDSCHNPHILTISILFSPSLDACSTVNKAAWSLFNRGFIMSYFPRSYNPFKQAASSQPVMSASLPACQTLIQPLSQPISQELLWVMARSRAFVWFHGNRACKMFMLVNRAVEKRVESVQSNTLSKIPSFPKSPCFHSCLSAQDYNWIHSVIILAEVQWIPAADANVAFSLLSTLPGSVGHSADPQPASLGPHGPDCSCRTEIYRGKMIIMKYLCWHNMWTCSETGSIQQKPVSLRGWNG